MRTDVLLDSNIIIDHLNDEQKATDYLETLPVLRVSSATVFEVLSGCTGTRSRQLDVARELFSICDVIDFSHPDAECAGGLYRKSPAKKKVLDYFIAATADTHALAVATRNPKDFQSVEAVEPYRLK